MNIVHLVTTDIGGAARAAIRINEAINKSKSKEYNSKIIVANKSSINTNIYTLEKNKFYKIKRVIYYFINRISLCKYSPKQPFSNEIIGFNVLKYKEIEKADIINIHWINGGMISYSTLNKLKNSNKKIVWTLHDMWAFTGGCHYDEECGRYESKCSKCKVLNSQNKNDLSTVIQNKKSKIYSNFDINIIGCSKWISESAKKSSLLYDKYNINIPNPINVDIFKPINKEIAKDILNIKTDKKIILFGAMSSTSDKRKGFSYLLESIKKLEKDKYLAVIFGNKNENSEIEKYIETKYIGQLLDDYSLSVLYNCADVFVAPSIQENLANTVMEALSCSVPVVAFNIGGMSDMIKHKLNGYLSKPLDSDSLTIGIKYCTENTIEMGKYARKYVLENYTYEIIGEKYRNFYDEILINRNELKK